MNKKTAFTLIELLAVIAIMAILAGILMPALSKAREKARVGKCIATIASLQTALSMYQVDYGVYPYSAAVSGAQHNGNSTGTTATNTLVKALTATTLGGPYMEFKGKDLNETTSGKPVLLDPWGRAYVYISRLAENGVKVTGEGPYHPDTADTSNNTYNIYSPGPDKMTHGFAVPITSSEWDDGKLYGNVDDGNWKDTTNKNNPQYDDINSWDGSRSG